MSLEPNGKGLFWTPTNGLAFSTRRRRKAPPVATAREVLARRTAERKASLAEYVAEGGSINQWSRENGTSTSNGSKMWRQIVAEMGWQAQ